jgi:hypothetical protein
LYDSIPDVAVYRFLEIQDAAEHFLSLGAENGKTGVSDKPRCNRNVTTAAIAASFRAMALIRRLRM